MSANGLNVKATRALKTLKDRDYVLVGTNDSETPYKVDLTTVKEKLEQNFIQLPANPQNGDALVWNGTEWEALNITPVSYEVGDFAQGGVVFWVDESGQHGLVANYKDATGNGPTVYSPVALGTALTYDNQINDQFYKQGYRNTNMILSYLLSQGILGGFAAARAIMGNDSEGSQYADWYLPSISELDLMYQNKSVIDSVSLEQGGEAINSNLVYWSSTGLTNGASWVLDMNGGAAAPSVNTNQNLVRAIRAF